MLNYEYPPLGGGAGNATCNIARELAGLGVDVDVLTSRFQTEPDEEIKDGVHIHRVRSIRKSIHNCGLRGALAYIFFSLPKARRMVKNNRYDVIHFFFSFPTGLLSFFLDKKTPYIVSLRGSDVPGYDKYSKSTHYLHSVMKPINMRIWRKAARVIALSEGLKEIALSSTPDLEIGVIHNGINTDTFHPGEKAQENDNTQIKLICVSRLLERKGIQYLFKALEAISDKNITLDILGKGNFEAQLKAMVSELGLGRQVNFLGYCPRPDLSEHYNKADIFVLPSLTESFGLVFAEAMACGLPIIGTTVGGIPEVVINKENGILVPPHDENALKEAILALIDDPQLREKMRRKNIQRALEHFKWKSVAEKYIKEYQLAAVN